MKLSARRKACPDSSGESVPTGRGDVWKLHGLEMGGEHWSHIACTYALASSPLLAGHGQVTQPLGFQDLGFLFRMLKIIIGLVSA